jgi:hypothetical protein
MNKSIVGRAVACAIIICVSLTPALAKGKKSSHTPAPTPHDIVISTISGNSITITDDKTTKTITATPFTEVTVNGQKATFADLKPGMTVSLVLSSPTQATRITAMTKK